MTVAELVKAMEDRAHTGRDVRVIATTPHRSYTFAVDSVEFSFDAGAVELRLVETTP